MRLLESLAEPLIPTSLNAACGEAASKDQAFEVSEISRVVSRQRSPEPTLAPAAAHVTWPHLLFILIYGARQLLDRFPHASVNVRREFSHILSFGVCRRAKRDNRHRPHPSSVHR